MTTEILHQFPGKQNLNEELKIALKNETFNQLRILVAYISWPGIRLIHKELELFHDSGKQVSMIIGVGDGYSESTGIRYLMERLYNANLFIFHAPLQSFTFHPKMYLFSNEVECLAFIGSNNFTTGGLFCNCECCVKLSLNYKSDAKTCEEVETVWSSYEEPLKPFEKGNLKRIDQKLLTDYSKQIEPLRRTRHKLKTPILKNIFPAVKIQRPAIPDVKVQTSTKKSSAKRILLLEILKETGVEGTQVQIPRKVIDEYFDVPSTGHQTIELQIGNRPIRPAVICHFGNNTHRVSFPELARHKRPLLMKIVKVKQNLYKVELLKGRNYEKFIKKCTHQTRSAARRWEILNAL
ncbi:MAG: phospholipase D family protein [Deltaproteobacteria bacterium]|nr:phospholipase D family protein [Deltaproteobacteria bacterium]